MYKIAIDKKHPDFESVYWLTHIKKSADDKRLWFNTILCEDNSLINTDGSTMCVVNLEHLEIPNGLLELVSRKRSEVVLMLTDKDPKEWPKWKVCFPSTDKKHQSFMIEKPAHFTIANIHRALEKNYFNIDYFLNVARGFDGDTVHVFDDDQPIYFENHKHRAIIMPMRG